MRINRNRAFLRSGLLFTSLLLTGCSRAPSFDILGSFFPAWLGCFVVAIVLTALTQLVLQRLGVRLAFPVLAYVSLAALYSFALWFIFVR